MQRNHFIKWRVSQHQMKNLSPLCNLGDSLVIHFSGDTLPEHQSVGILTQIQMGGRLTSQAKEINISLVLTPFKFRITSKSWEVPICGQILLEVVLMYLAPCKQI